MIKSAKKGVRQLVELFHKKGIHKIVFSPGSRNAPLVMSFGNDDRFEKFVIPDERSAAFYALGMAEQLNKPVAIMCTSGSALLNYYPAITEAYYRSIPLVVVSADRPQQWIDQGIGQSIHQEDAFKNHVLAATTLLESPKTKEEEWYNNRLINEVLQPIDSSIKGPVHINFPFSEPLYESVKSEENEVLVSNYSFMTPEELFSQDQKNELISIWNKSKRKLILCGQLPKNNYLKEQLKKLAADKEVAVVVENTSNLQDRSFIHCIDRTINSITNNTIHLYQPDLLITFGGAIVSKKIKKLLKENKLSHHWKIGHQRPFMDAFQSLTHSIPINENYFLDFITEECEVKNRTRFGEQWKQLDYMAEDLHFNFLRSTPYSDLKVIDFLLDCIPDNSNLHLSNSSVIRYSQLFNPIQYITYFSNRGVSGIDGVMSTALGNTLASVKDKVNTLIIGDMAFFYDSNAFWNHYLPTNFRVFLINNGGGGIFDIIDGPSTSALKDEYFTTRQQLDAKGICKTFSVNYFQAHSIEEIDAQLDEFYDVLPNERPAVMEIFTDTVESSKVLKAYFKSIKVNNIPQLKA